MSLHRIELVNKDTGEEINVLASSIQVLSSYENELGEEVTLITIAGKTIVVEVNYYSMRYALEEAGYPTKARIDYKEPLPIRKDQVIQNLATEINYIKEKVEKLEKKLQSNLK